MAGFGDAMKGAIARRMAKAEADSGKSQDQLLAERNKARAKANAEVKPFTEGSKAADEG